MPRKPQSCNESARCVPSVCTAQRPSGRDSTDTSGSGTASALASQLIEEHCPKPSAPDYINCTSRIREALSFGPASPTFWIVELARRPCGEGDDRITRATFRRPPRR